MSWTTAKVRSLVEAVQEFKLDTDVTKNSAEHRCARCLTLSTATNRWFVCADAAALQTNVFASYVYVSVGSKVGYFEPLLSENGNMGVIEST